MLINLRDTMADVEKNGEAALHWAKDGLHAMRGAVKDGPMLWGAATIGLLAGGLFALWRRNGKSRSMPHKSVAVRNSKKPHRSTSKTAAINGKAKKARPRRVQPALSS